MKSIYLVLFAVFFCVGLNNADDLQIGNSVGSTLAYLENVKMSGISLKTRTKTVFFSSDKNQIIKAISAIDQKKSGAKATVTAGGVGSSFVNIKIKGERGEGLDYQVQIYV